MHNDINYIDSKLLQEDDRIFAYLKGKMTKEEEALFLKDLNDNPELKEKAVVMARLVKGLKEVGISNDKDIRGAFLASDEQAVETVAKRTTQKDTAIPKNVNAISFRKVSVWLSIAASLIFIVWLGIDYNGYRKTTGLGEEYDDVFSSSLIVRGSGTPTEAEKKLEMLFSDVKEDRNIDDAIHELSLCWELSTMDIYNDYTNYSAEIGWYLAIAHLKNNDKKMARKVLEKLIETSEEESALNIKAKELSERLK